MYAKEEQYWFGFRDFDFRDFGFRDFSFRDFDFRDFGAKPPYQYFLILIPV